MLLMNNESNFDRRAAENRSKELLITTISSNLVRISNILKPREEKSEYMPSLDTLELEILNAQSPDLRERIENIKTSLSVSDEKSLSRILNPNDSYLTISRIKLELPVINDEIEKLALSVTRHGKTLSSGLRIIKQDLANISRLINSL